MKRMIFLAASMMVLLMACFPVSGQELKPLKSFCGNENEYLKGNFENEHDLFKGRSFGYLINALEAKLLTATIHYKMDKSSFFMDIYLQSPEYVKNTARLKETHLTGISVLFEENSALEDATGKVFETFPGDPATVSFTKKNMDKLIDLLKNVKIRKVFYEDITNRWVTTD